MCRALVLLAEADVPIELALTMYPENQQDIVENLSSLLDELADRGVRPVRAGISRGMRQGRASRNLDVLEFEESFLEAKRRTYGQLWDLKRFKAVKVRSCGYGATLTVLSTGEVLPCGINDGTGVNVREQSLDSIYRRFKAMGDASAVTLMRPCRRCDLRFICGGGCRIVHRSAHGDARLAACSRSDRELYYRRLMARDEVFFKISGMLDAAER
jgi:radical SAM protein with 4Fe4S-binding SPASM domain